MCFRIAAVIPVLILAAFGQLPDRPLPDPRNPDPNHSETRLPNGKLQRDEIVKAEYEKSLQDATELVKLSEDLKAELEKNSAFIVSIPSIKKTEEIEKLAKRIRSRMKRG